MANTPTIIYTKTDEAPALATQSLLPIIKSEFFNKVRKYSNLTDGKILNRGLSLNLEYAFNIDLLPRSLLG